MSDSTPITQALRGRLTVAALMQGHELSTPLAKGVLAECDNIDALHKALEDENAEMREFCNRLEDAAKKREDVTIFGADYTALPLDADGVPIHVGDEMIWYSTSGKWPTRLVAAITNEGFITYDEALGGYAICQAAHYRYYHKPTVTDVLREFAADFVGCANCVDDHEVTDAIELFAPKLRLAGDAE